MSERAHTATPGPLEAPAADAALVEAYHDGELSHLARWRFERRLRREPALRRELAALGELRELLRAHHEDASPDLWESLAPRLSAARAGAAATRPQRPAWAWVAVPGAAAATAALVLALVQGGPGGAPPASGAAAGEVVRWLDSGERNVVVLQGDADTTIIWVLDAPAAPTEGAGGGGRDGGLWT